MGKKKRKGNYEASQVLEEYGIKVMEYFDKDEHSEYDYITFIDKTTRRVTELDCIRTIQILASEGFRVCDCNLRIRVIDGVVEPPSGKITFFSC